jgi:hypothetical protein
VVNDLKAVVSVTADTSGLIRGVDGAMQKLNSISRNTSLMAGMTAAQQVFGALQQLWTAISNRSEELGKLAVQFSPEAMSAAAQRSIAEFQANQKIGQALGPYQAGIEQMKAASATEQATKVTADAEALGQGMIVIESLKTTAGELGTGFIDGIIKALGGSAMDAASLGTATAFERTGATDMIAEVLTPVVGWVEDIANKIGGD